MCRPDSRLDPAGANPALTPGSAMPPPAVFLSQVDGWIRKLSGKLAPRLGMCPAEFANEVRIDVFLHLASYEPARGRPTMWVMWRVRKVFNHIRRDARRRRTIRPRLFSQMGGRPGDGQDRDAGAAIPLARPDPHAGGGRIQEREDEAELREAVRAAVAGLSASQRLSIELLYGVGRAAATTRAELRARTGLTPQAVYDSAKFARNNLRRSSKLRELARERGLRPGDVTG